MDAQELAARVVAGERRALAQAITLVESTRPEDRAAALTLIEAAAATGRQSLRVGLSGAPGVGKSTFIEAFGLMLTDIGHRVAVLAVDPSSAQTGGSILGDKTRMERLSRDPRAFIRPSPSRAMLGGIARGTGAAVGLCEAAGFDVVLVETVGVGQSETAVAGIVDVFVVLLAPAGGDELQGVKRGILELADVLLFTKADNDLLASAERTRAEHASALRLVRARPGDPADYPRAMCVSALQGTGLPEAWTAIKTLADFRRDSGWFGMRRAAQDRQRFEADVREALFQAMLARADLADAVARIGNAVEAGVMRPERGAVEVLRLLDRS